MRWLVRSVLFVAIAVLLTACNNSSSPSTAEGTGDGRSTADLRSGQRRGTGNSAKPLPVSSEDGPDEVVRAFLEAARAGEESTATQLLTDKAREETQREGLALDPPGTPSMKYEIGKVEYHEQDPHAAYVNSLWIETTLPTDDRFEVVWVLRRQSQGWRIAGMAAQMEANQSPVFLNFEDPQDVARIKSELGDEPGAVVARGVKSDEGTRR